MDLAIIHLTVEIGIKGNTKIMLQMGQGLKFFHQVVAWQQYIKIIHQMGWVYITIAMDRKYQVHLNKIIFKELALRLMQMVLGLRKDMNMDNFLNNYYDQV